MSGLDVEIVGNGRNVVLLHSLLSDRGAYAPLAKKLAAERRVVMPNLPGYGASAPLPDTSLAAFADAVAELFDDLALPPETDLVGNGFGGFVALTFAARHGDRFDRLLLIGSTVAFPDAGRATFRGLAGKVESAGMAAVSEAAVKRMLPEDYIAARPEVAAERRVAFERIDPAVFAAACHALADMHLGEQVAKVRNRTLVVAGPKDGATPPALGRELAARLPRAEMIEMPGVGHTPHLEATDAFLAIIAPFLGLKGAAAETAMPSMRSSR